MPLGLVALAIGGFGIGLTELVTMGLLPEVAADFGVSEGSTDRADVPAPAHLDDAHSAASVA